MVDSLKSPSSPWKMKTTIFKLHSEYLRNSLTRIFLIKSCKDGKNIVKVAYISHAHFFAGNKYWQILIWHFNAIFLISASMHASLYHVLINFTWWRHQIETFSTLGSRGDSPHKSQWREALMFSMISAYTTCWANNRDAGGLRRHRAHYDLTVMYRCASAKLLASI